MLQAAAGEVLPFDSTMPVVPTGMMHAIAWQVASMHELHHGEAGIPTTCPFPVATAAAAGCCSSTAP